MLTVAAGCNSVCGGGGAGVPAESPQAAGVKGGGRLHGAAEREALKNQ